MNTNPKYNPEDLEDLLLHKSFDELHESEQEFVLQHIDSISEYKELRNTLLSIKEYSQNNEQIVAEPKVKEALLELFEKESRKPFAWFSLNSIGAFLFPTETTIFRKPAFQIATFAILALFVVNIGTNLTPEMSDNLAQNTKVSVEKESLIIEKLDKVVTKEEAKPIEPIESKSTELKEVEIQKNSDSETKSTDDLIQHKDLESEKTKFRNKTENLKEAKGYFKTIPGNNSSKEKRENSLTEIKDEILDEEMEEITQNNGTLISLDEVTTTQRAATNKVKMVTLSRNDAYSDLDISENVNSQSLENEEELIDLLYITM